MFVLNLGHTILHFKFLEIDKLSPMLIFQEVQLLYKPTFCKPCLWNLHTTVTFKLTATVYERHMLPHFITTFKRTFAHATPLRGQFVCSKNGIKRHRQVENRIYKPKCEFYSYRKMKVDKWIWNAFVTNYNDLVEKTRQNWKSLYLLLSVQGVPNSMSQSCYWLIIHANKNFTWKIQIESFKTCLWPNILFF